MILKNKPQVFLPAGLSLLAVGVMIQHFVPGTPVINFVAGMMIGMSIVFNIAGLFGVRKLVNKS